MDHTNRKETALVPSSDQQDGQLRPDGSLFYWAILCPIPAKADRETLLYALEPWLPVGLNDVEARFCMAPGGSTVLACAIGRSELQELLDRDNSGIRSIKPRSLAAPIRENLGLDQETEAECLSGLEFRSGVFASARHRACNRITLVAAGIGLALLLASVLFAMRSRTESFRMYAHSANAAMHSAVEERLGPSSQATLDPRLRLASEIRLLEATRTKRTDIAYPADITDIYVDLLAAWPEDTHITVQSLRIAGVRVVIKGEAKEPSQFDRLMASLESRGAAFGIGERAINRANKGFRYSLTLSPDAASENSSVAAE